MFDIKFLIHSRVIPQSIDYKDTPISLNSIACSRSLFLCSLIKMDSSSRLTLEKTWKILKEISAEMLTAPRRDLRE